MPAATKKPFVPFQKGGKKAPPFPIKGKPGEEPDEDDAEGRRKRMNKGKLPGLEKMPFAAMKKGKK